MAIIVDVVIALFFFLAGCVKLGSFIAVSSVESIPDYVDSLLVQSWPLAVAAVLFALIDIRTHSAARPENEEDVDIPESPLPKHMAARPIVGAPRPTAHVSYFHVDGQELPPSHSVGPKPEHHDGRKDSPLTPPPPFEEKAPSTPEPTADSSKKHDADLNFFKL